MRLFIGIDPGVNGGIAAVMEDGTLHAVWPMPKTDRDVLAVLVELALSD